MSGVDALIDPKQEEEEDLFGDDTGLDNNNDDDPFDAEEEGDAADDGEDGNDGEEDERAEEDGDDNEEEDEDVGGNDFQQKDTDKKKKRKRAAATEKKAKKSRKKVTRYNFFNEEAEVADSEEEDDEYETAEKEEVLDKDHLDAIARVEKRHNINRDFQKKSADELVADIEKRHQYQEQFKQQFEDNEGFLGQQATPVAQQALLPSFKDPKLFKIKCKLGQEQMIVRAIMLKTIDLQQQNNDFFKIKSAFCGPSKGYIYVEAISENFAKEVLNGFKMIYLNSFQQVPITDMTSVLAVTIKKKPLKPGDYIRIKRGVLKGDLARVIDVFDGETKALIQAVPRIVYNTEENSLNLDGSLPGKKKVLLSSKLNKVRPPQALFDPEQASASHNGYVFRRHHPLDPSAALYDVWNGEYYKDGFLFKEVNVDTFIDNQFTNKPKLEELRMFIIDQTNKNSNNGFNDEDDDGPDFLSTSNKKKEEKKAKKVKKPVNPEDDEDANALRDDEDQDEPEDDNDMDVEERGRPIANTLSNMNADLAKEIAKLTADEDPMKANPFVVGDIVKVIGGEMVNLIGRIMSVHDVTKTATIRPYNHITLTNEFDVEISLLVKYVEPGAHVKVTTGRYAGTTGRVVSVTTGVTANDQLAIILTDGLNTEITCNVSILQISDEVATGLGNLMGFELYDLVKLNENESAVVINVGTEKLKVMNHLSDVKDVAPQEIRGKLNNISQKTKALDASQNSMGVGDTVHVLSGPSSKLSGTIKHINKATLWLHSNTYHKNSGIFVVRGRNVALAGVSANNSGGGSMSVGGGFNHYGGAGSNPLGSTISQQSTPSLGFVSRTPVGRNNGGPGGGGGGRGGGRDTARGKTVRITKGKYKGKLGQVVDETTTHYSVEILSMFKKDMVKKVDAIIVGDKEGSFDRHRSAAHVAAELPEYSIAASTPYLSAQTPIHVLGSETPRVFGNETPYLGVGGDDDLPSQESSWQITDMDRANPYSSYGGSSGNFEDSSQMSFSRTTTPAMTDFNSTPRDLSVSGMLSPPYSTSGSMMPPPSSSISTSESENLIINNMVVIMKKGKHVGRMAVVQDHENGQVRLRLRDGQGRLQGDDLMVTSDNFAPADPPKGSTVFVARGPHKGRVATVKSLLGKAELSVQFEDDVDGSSETLKKNVLVW
eukprot:CAMPEP_0173156230 /NCGR_PEP_ID=MMETSP1105-20130129/14646_1 /TAXON_ID=2985 /ORGANISM="Ochromonas sp., Strain BG-1" /LENGTH=1165 /DNA_ID=CAMNT_0014072945 /DNA_START=63 /DNA_END=3557 /DNA_ORIENTATION=+